MPEDDDEELSEKDIEEALSEYTLSIEHVLFEHFLRVFQKKGAPDALLEKYRQDFEKYMTLQNQDIRKTLPEIAWELPRNLWLEIFLRFFGGQKRQQLPEEEKERLVNEIANIIRKKKDGTDTM